MIFPGTSSQSWQVSLAFLEIYVKSSVDSQKDQLLLEAIFLKGSPVISSNSSKTHPQAPL